MPNPRDSDCGLCRRRRVTGRRDRRVIISDWGIRKAGGFCCIPIDVFSARVKAPPAEAEVGAAPPVVDEVGNLERLLSTTATSVHRDRKSVV